MAWSQGRDEEVPRTKRWKTPGFLHQEEEAGPVEETVTEARGMQSGGQHTVLAEGGEQAFLAVQALQMPLRPLSPESHLRPSRENERGCGNARGQEGEH